MYRVASEDTVRDAVLWLCAEAEREDVGASLVGASLVGASLDGASLVGANLVGANLVGANLSRLPLARSDFFAVLDAAPSAAPSLLIALRAGKIDGLKYTGECSCLLGTIATAMGQDVDNLPGLPKNGERPAERWFLQIRPGHTPEISAVAAITEVWILEWQTRHAT